MIQKLTVFLFSTALYFTSFSQELNCEVSIVTNPNLDVTSVEQDIFRELEQTIYEFMNNTAWTKDEFEVEERINCVVQVQINSIPSPGRYEANLQIQSTRPVYNSTYNTSLLNFIDEDFNFAYARNALLVYAPTEFRDNLTSSLAFYANIILGYDYDSFSLKGGTPYFEIAQNIVTLAQSSGGSGWLSNSRGRNNRYWLIDNILQPQFEPLRILYYNYHRQGLDNLYNNKENARTACYKALENLTKVHQARPGAMNTVIFAKMKLEELKGLYIDAEVKDKNNVINLLKRVDPANSSRYQEILNG